ncbi:cilia- and flagella-associated protein 157-like [Xenentodon cancila]
MPRKKEKSRGENTDERKTTSKKQSPATPANKTGVDDKEKDLYLIQIQHLTEELETCQLKCDKLERQNTDLVSKRSTLEKDRKDFVEHLRHCLVEKDGEVEDLAQQLQSLQRAFDQDRDALQLQQAQMRQQLQDQIHHLVEKNTTLAARLAALEEFQKQREELMSDVDSLEKQLALQKEEHKEEIHSLEMKALLEKKRFEKEMENHVAAMEAEVQHLVNQKLPETTRLALQDIVELKACYNQLSEHAQLLTVENSALRQQKSQLIMDVDILEQMLRKTSRMSCIHKRKVDEQTEMCQKLQVEQKNFQQQLERLQTKHTQLLAEMDELRKARLDPDSGSQVQVTHDRTNGLNLVPRPSQTQKNQLRTAAGCSSTTVPLLRKPVSQTPSSSRNPTQAAVGLFTSQQSRDVKPSIKHNRRPW